MYDKCELCKDKKLDFESSENSKTDDFIVSWLYWERKDHTYSKKEGSEFSHLFSPFSLTSFKRKMTNKVTKSGT